MVAVVSVEGHYYLAGGMPGQQEARDWPEL